MDNSLTPSAFESSVTGLMESNDERCGSLLSVSKNVAVLVCNLVGSGCIIEIAVCCMYVGPIIILLKMYNVSVYKGFVWYA